jgi:hypothetical protein
MDFKKTNCVRCSKEYYPVNANSKYCSVECRFWSKVNRKSDNECWEWLGAKSKKDGYGILRVHNKGVKAHQLVWKICFGEVLKSNTNSYHGTCVLHTCDNPGCCNPKHLYLGTHSDNMKDAVSRDRRRSYAGINNPASKLNAEQVKSIKQLTNLNIPSRAVAKHFCVGQSTVLRIRNNETYLSVL